MKNLIILSAIVFSLISCGGGDVDPPAPNNPKSLDQGSYSIEFAIHGDTITRDSLVVDFADTNWDPDLGLIFLNTDESRSCGVGICPCLKGPIGTLTMTIDSINIDKGTAKVTSILISKSNGACGTAIELNPKLFEAAPGNNVIFNVNIGLNFISGEFIIPMELVIVNPMQQPQSATVTGIFTAISN